MQNRIKYLNAIEFLTKTFSCLKKFHSNKEKETNIPETSFFISLDLLGMSVILLTIPGTNNGSSKEKLFATLSRSSFVVDDLLHFFAATCQKFPSIAFAGESRSIIVNLPGSI